MAQGFLSLDQYNEISGQVAQQYESDLSYVRKHGVLPLDFEQSCGLPEELRPQLRRIHAAQGGRVRYPPRY